MVELDDATRARLEHLRDHLKAWPFQDMQRDADDLTALFAAYDALLAERDDARDAARTSVDYFSEKIATIEAAPAQAAPVLAAADRWLDTFGPAQPYDEPWYTPWQELVDAVESWRAAREG